MTKRHKRDSDSITNGILYEGASLLQLAKLFEIDGKFIKGKIQGLEPCGTRLGHPIFKVKDAAPYLIKPRFTEEEFVKKMTKYDLPATVTREYWQGKRAQQIYQKEAGELWPTEEVVNHISEIIKIITSNLRLVPNLIERKEQLTNSQKALIFSVIDDIMAQLHDKINEYLPDEDEL